MVSRGRILTQAVLLAGALAGLGSPATAAARSTAWHGCGSVSERPRYGYVSRNRVQARDPISCAVARHIGRRFLRGGYQYQGLVCYYGSSGVGNPYWNWSCTKGTRVHPGRREVVRAHETSIRV